MASIESSEAAVREAIVRLREKDQESVDDSETARTVQKTKMPAGYTPFYGGFYQSDGEPVIDERYDCNVGIRSKRIK